MNDETCQTQAAAEQSHQKYLSFIQEEAQNLHTVEKLVIATVISFAMVFLLCGLKNRFARTWLKLISSACYMGVPILISYTLGIMGKPGNSQGWSDAFIPVYAAWAVFLLFAHASFDNLIAFNLEEINGRSKLMFQFWSQYFLLLLIMRSWINGRSIRLLMLFVPVLLVSLVVYLKLMERHFALAYASGSSSFLRENLRKMVNFVNKDTHQAEAGAGAGADFKSMHGVPYLVGPNYATTKDGEIEEGITLEKIWGCNGGKLLSSEYLDGQLKDMCLSFSLFWVLLAKIRGYRSVYTTRSSKMKAYKLLWERLLTDEDKAFRVIEVELSFLLDYFYSKYMLFYFTGIYAKLIPIIGFPIMYWYFTGTAYKYKRINSNYAKAGVDLNYNSGPFKIMILVLYALEIIQLLMYVTSKWYNVNLICFYAKKKPGSFLRQCFGGVISAICRVSLCTTSIFCKPWKRELNQYCLLKSCTCFSINNKTLRLYLSMFGVSLPQPGMKEDASVALSKDVKRAVILSLQKNGPNLSNGVASLRRGGVEEKLSWALNLKTNSEAILVWHIATSICEMKCHNQQDFEPEGFQVATTLSKYCAHLLNFAPLLVSVPVLEAEVICETTIKEARALLKTPISYCGPCGRVNVASKYEKLMDHLTNGDEEIGEGRNTTILQNGIRLGKDIDAIAGDERWKILAEFWAEFILFLAPSDINELAHAEKLAEGGEFITHLWALLIHAGILD